MNRFKTLVATTLLAAFGTASATIIDLTIDPKATVALGGTLVLIKGTITCDFTPGALFSSTNLSGDVLQFSVGGKVFSRGSFFVSPQCDGSAVPFVATVQTGLFGASPFKPGKAEASLFASQFECFFDGVNFLCNQSSKSAQSKISLNP